MVNYMEPEPKEKYTIRIPKQYNDKSKIPRGEIEEYHKDIVEYFGGEGISKEEGRWINKNSNIDIDINYKVEINGDKNQHERNLLFIKYLTRDMGRKFGQSEIYIEENNVNIYVVKGERIDSFLPKPSKKEIKYVLDIKKIEHILDILNDPEIDDEEIRLENFIKLRHQFPELSNRKIAIEEIELIFQCLKLYEENFEKPYREPIIDSLDLIVKVGNDAIKKYLKNNFKEKIEKLFNSFDIKEKSYAISILQRFSNFDFNFIKNLINQSINEWTNEEFIQLKDVIYIGQISDKKQLNKYLLTQKSKLKNLKDKITDEDNQIQNRIDRINTYLDKLKSWVY